MLKKGELKPCPFCNGIKLDIIDGECEGFGGIGKAVVCNYNQGGCGATGGFRPTEEEAIEVWNRRCYGK